MLSKLEDPRGLKTIDEIGYYWGEGTNKISPEEFEAVFKRFGRKGELALQTFATKMRTEGREEGRTEGRVEGLDTIQNAIIDTLYARFDHVTANIEKRLFAINDLNLLRRLVPKAALANSLADFEANLD